MLANYRRYSAFLEEDPDRNRELLKIALQVAQEVIRNFKIINLRTWNSYYPTTSIVGGLASFEVNVEQKYVLYKKAVENGKKAVELIEGWRHSAVPAILNIYTSVLYRLSEIETNIIRGR